MAYEKLNLANGTALDETHLAHMECGIEKAVSYDTQTLTNAQKTQARDNIGVLSAAEVDAKILETDISIQVVSGELITIPVGDDESLNLKLSSDTESGVLYKTGQNLFYKLRPKTYNGVTLTVEDDGTLILNGTCTGDYNFTLNRPLPKGDFSLCDNCEGEWPTTTVARTQVVLLGTVDGTIHHHRASNYVVNFTSTAYSAVVNFRVRVVSGFTYNNCKIRPMLVVGTYASANMPDFTPCANETVETIILTGGAASIKITETTTLFTDDSTTVTAAYKTNVLANMATKEDLEGLATKEDLEASQTLLSGIVSETKNLVDPFGCVDNAVIVSATGGLTSNVSYWVTNIFPVSSGVTKIFSNIYAYHIACYDADMVYLGNVAPGVYDLFEGTAFARVQYSKTHMAYEARFGLLVAEGELTDYAPHHKLDKRVIAADMADYSARAIGDYVFKFPITNPFYVSDHTFIGEELFAVNACVKDDHTDTAPVTVYTVDPATKTATYLRQFTHNLGHCNTVDYCAGNDCLIMGNGSADATLAGKIFILPHPSTTENWTFDDCIVIDMEAENWGIKMQALWGEHNDEKYNIVYVITNNNADVHKIMLTKDAEGNFDGGYIVLDAWHNDHGLDVNQGSTFHDGKIWAAIGHAQMWVTETQLLNDGTMKQVSRKDFMYDDTGAIRIAPFAEGIAFRDGYVYVGGSDSTIRVYKTN